MKTVISPLNGSTYVYPGDVNKKKFYGAAFTNGVNRGMIRSNGYVSSIDVPAKWGIFAIGLFTVSNGWDLFDTEEPLTFIEYIAWLVQKPEITGVYEFDSFKELVEWVSGGESK